MGIDFDSLKNVANGENVDQAAEFAKSRFSDHADKIDEVASRAKDLLAGESCGEQVGHRDQAPAQFDAAASDSGALAESVFDHPQDSEYGRHSASNRDAPPSVDEYGGSVTHNAPVKNFYFDDGAPS